MQREPRLQLKRTWRIRQIIAIALFVWLAAAVCVTHLERINVPLTSKLALGLNSIPTVPLLASVLPRGDSPFFMPWEFLILLAAMIPVFVCITRFRYHVEQLKEEDRARNLRDI